MICTATLLSDVPVTIKCVFVLLRNTSQDGFTLRELSGSVPQVHTMKQEYWLEDFRNVEQNQIRNMFEIQVMSVRSGVCCHCAQPDLIMAAFFLFCTKV